MGRVSSVERRFRRDKALPLYILLSYQYASAADINDFGADIGAGDELFPLFE